VIILADYKEMYLTMMRAAEQAINILIAAQQACEEAYLQEDAPHIFILESESDNAKQESGGQASALLIPVG
jgi:hypothetical protein